MPRPGAGFKPCAEGEVTEAESSGQNGANGPEGARMAEKQRSGGCLCGAIRFWVTGPMRDVVVCHCGQCRKQHGAPPGYSNAEWVKIELKGESDLAWYQSSDKARRGFCRICGSSLFWERIDSGRVSIAAGALDQPTGLKTVRHIFVADKPDWYEINDGIEQLSGTMIDAKPV